MLKMGVTTPGTSETKTAGGDGEAVEGEKPVLRVVC